MKFFRNMLLAACVAASSATAMAQNEKMVVYLSDGTSQAISASDIDHVEFSTNSTVPADAKFQLSVTDVHSLYCTFNAVPAEGVGTYNVMYDLKSVYDQFDSEAALVAEDINLYKQWAQSYQMTFADLLKLFCSQVMPSSSSPVSVRERTISFGPMVSTPKATRPLRSQP